MPRVDPWFATSWVALSGCPLVLYVTTPGRAVWRLKPLCKLASQPPMTTTCHPPWRPRFDALSAVPTLRCPAIWTDRVSAVIAPRAGGAVGALTAVGAHRTCLAARCRLRYAGSPCGAPGQRRSRSRSRRGQSAFERRDAETADRPGRVSIVRRFRLSPALKTASVSTWLAAT